MRIGSAFLKARDNKEDRIQKRRSDNMAAFNSYVKTQAELGVDASVQDLETMKRNLAGGDFYYGKQLPSSNVIEETSARLGAIQADKDAKFASTRLANQRTRLDNLKATLDGYIGVNVNDNDWWNKNRTKGSLPDLIDIYGEAQAKNYLGMLNTEALGKYITTFNVQQYKTKEGIETAIAAAPSHFQAGVKSFLEGNRQRHVAQSESAAETALIQNLTTVMADIDNTSDAADAAVNYIKRFLPSEIEMSKTFEDRIRLSAATDFSQLRNRQMEAVIGKAQGEKVPAAYANNSAEIERLVNKYASEVFDEDNNSVEAENFRTRLRNDLLANATLSLTTIEDAAITEIKGTISDLRLDVAENMSTDDGDINELVDQYIAGSRIDLNGTRWKKNGQFTPAYLTLHAQIKSHLLAKLNIANDIEFAADETLMMNEIMGAVDPASTPGDARPSVIERLINEEKDQNRKQKLFAEVNRIRESYGRVPFKDYDDKEWQPIWQHLQRKIGLRQSDLYREKSKGLTATAKTMVEEAQKQTRDLLADWAGGLDDEPEGRQDYRALSQMVGQYFIPPERVEAVFNAVTTALPDDEDYEQSNAANFSEFQRIIREVAQAQGLLPLQTGITTYTNNYINAGMDGLVEPGTTVLNWGKGVLDLSFQLSDPHYNKLISLPRDTAQSVVTEQQEKLKSHIKDLKLLRDRTLRIELQAPELAEILDDGASATAAMSELRSRLNAKIALYEKAVPQGMPSFLRHIPNTETYQVNEPNAETARKAGFQVGVKYVIDENDPKGFIVDVASNVAADPTGAEPINSNNVEVFDTPTMANIQVDLSKVNKSVAEEFQRAYNGFSPSVEPTGQQRQILNYMLKNEKVMAYFQRIGRPTAKERAAMLQDPLAWFANVAEPDTQIKDNSLMGPRFNKADIAEKEIENIYDSFFSSMDLVEQ